MQKHNQMIDRLLGALGVLAILNFVGWWAQDERYRSPLLLLVLAAALAYIIFQMGCSWILNLTARAPSPSPKPQGNRRVDVFVTAYREPVEMVRATLTAALAMHGPKQVWLLDDGRDPALAELARQLGSGYLTRQDNRDAKAGNINAALERTNGDIIAIFDIDHAPEPDFLAKSLGYFNDPQMGFVQVMLTFRNFDESWVARAATESSLEFYNPTYLGANRLGGATLMGSNALIRREALKSIGGYRPGLAEDLATSLQLHAAGWHSAYVAEPLAPGLSPANLTAWSVQQLKWARGVFELLLTKLPRVAGRLTWGQRISYSVRMTKYWVGPAIFAHLVATILVLFWADAGTQLSFNLYLWSLGPLILVDAVIRWYALYNYRHADVRHSSLSSAVVLVYASWPIYLLAWTLALLRLPVRFHPTPKNCNGSLNILWLLPQLLTLILLVIGKFHTIVFCRHGVSLLLAFSIVQALIQLVLMAKWVQEDWSRQPGFRSRFLMRGSNTYANRNP
jgi:cellulose synthase (UDP-forming)